MKLLLEELCVEAGVKFQFHTRVAAAYRDGRRLTTIVTESKSGRQAWRAPVFIDTTGDGDLGALAGCAFEIGEAEGLPLPADVAQCAARREGRRRARRRSSIAPTRATHDNVAKDNFLAEIERAGPSPPTASPRSGRCATICCS